MSWNNNRGMPPIKRQTHELDATGQVVGRLATKIATLLMGKHKPSYVPHIDAGDIVKVKNVDKLVFTGKKWEQKAHFKSSNRPSGVRRIPVSMLRRDNPGEILHHAVKYMLPKNRQQTARLKRLIIV